jgi:hypothetical protein
MGQTTLGVPARAALLALMATGREIANADLRPWLGSKGIEKKVRERLNGEKLIVSRPVGRSFHHQLTPGGWQWCLDELLAGPPPRSGSMGGALYAVLQGLASHLERSGAALADIFGKGDGARERDRGVEDAIRERYWKLAAYPNDWVRLADIRSTLASFDRQAVDQALVELNRQPDVNLAPEPIQSLLTDSDAEAAVEVGGRANHLLAIDSDG